MTEATQPMFQRAVVAFDALHRVYMRLVTYTSPAKECRTVFGAKMPCRSRDFVQRRIRFFGVFEHNLTYYTLSRLRPGDAYIDVGANVGYFTLLASRAVGPSGKVVAVEADPATFAALRENLRLNGCANVRALNAAATGERCKVAVVAGEDHNAGTNSIRIDASAGTIDGVPFSDIAGEDAGRTRFVKIDIEGSEQPVLRGVLEALPRLPPDLVVASEISPASAGLVADFIEAGFRAYAIQNVYTIDYYLIRSYLRKHREGRGFHLEPVAAYDPSCRDYVFERGAP
jgi:FkbM family methyltransferase